MLLAIRYTLLAIRYKIGRMTANAAVTVRQAELADVPAITEIFNEAIFYHNGHVRSRTENH